MAAKARNVIVTSGTLAPFAALEAELGVQFQTQWSSPHVVDMQSQVWAAAGAAGWRDVSYPAVVDSYPPKQAHYVMIVHVCVCS
jgi:Fanconi anemia group J protein